MSTVKELVLHHLIHTFEKEAWQPPLSFAVAGLTAEQAAWKPAPERHSIWQIVRHVIHWKEGVLVALDGAPMAYEALARGDWNAVSGDQAAWDADVRRLRDVSMRLKARVEETDADGLARALPWYAGAAARPVDKRVIDVATHDIYHAGQIQYIRALQEIPSDQFFQAAIDGNTVKLRGLLDAHPDLLNAMSRDGWTALMLASGFGQRAVVEFLLDRGADLHAVSTNEEAVTALRSAEEGKHAETAELLRSRGAR